MDKRDQKLDYLLLFRRISIGTGILVGILLLCAVITGVGLFYYLNEYAFDNKRPYIGLDSYMREASLNALTLNRDDSVDITMNEDVFNSLMLKNKGAIQNYLPFEYEILDLSIDLKENKLFINGRKGLSLVPVSADAEFAIAHGNLEIGLSNINLGSKESAFMASIIKVLTKAQTLDIVVPVKELTIFPRFLAVDGLTVKEQQVMIHANMNLKDIGRYFMDYKAYMDPIIIEDYQGQEDESKALILRTLKEENMSDEDVLVMVKDIFNEQVIIAEFIYALNAEGIKNLYTDYGFLLHDSVEETYRMKGEKVISRKVEIANYLLTLLEEYLISNDIKYVNDGGILYDSSRQEHITLQYLKSLYTINSDVMKKEMESCTYYMKDGVFYVKYILNDQQMLIVSKETYQLTSITDANQLFPVSSIESTGNEDVKASSQEASAVKEGIQTYVETEDDLYFRFLNIGSNYAYAIVSFEKTYQTMHSYALQREGDKWVTMIHDLPNKQLNTSYPMFNIKLTPPYDYREVRLKQISRYGRQAIIEELRIKGLYPGGSIAFCSYIGDTIFVQLTGGEEFVLKNDEGTLNKALARIEAEEKWEIPTLLMSIPQ